MKKHIALGLLLFSGCCIASAQTTNAPATTNTPSLLTEDKAVKIALRIADDKLREERTGYYVIPDFPLFEINASNNPEIKRTHIENMGHPGTRIQSRFEDRHWIIDLFTWDSHSSYYCTVQLASDGSTNSAVYRREGGLQ